MCCRARAVYLSVLQKPGCYFVCVAGTGLPALLCAPESGSETKLLLTADDAPASAGTLFVSGGMDLMQIKNKPNHVKVSEILMAAHSIAILLQW